MKRQIPRTESKRERDGWRRDVADDLSDTLTASDVLGTALQITVTINPDGTITLSLPQDIDLNADVEFRSALLDYLDFALDKTVSSQEARLSWNNDDKTLNIDTGLGPVLQTNQETVVLVYNDTGVEISNGAVVHPVGGATNGRPHVELAISNVHTGIDRDIWVATMVIPIDTVGIVTKFGYVRGIDTNLFSAGDNLWISPDNAGEYVNTLPEFPDYAIQVGGVAVSDAVDGVIFVDIKGRPVDTILNFWNGVFREPFNFFVTSDGATITGSLSPKNGHEDMTMIFSDGFTLLDTTPAATITLTGGTDTNPQTNFVYILETTKVLTVSISDWPEVEHIKVAQVFLQTAATTLTEGGLRNQNINDPIEDTATFQGHLSHITEKLRAFEAQWWTGTEGSAVIDTTPTPDSVIIKTTAGEVRQLHLQDFQLQDMTQYTIDSVSTGLGGAFTISDDGDLSTTFLDDSTLSVHNSSNNDGIWTIASTLYSAPDFIITVVETVGAVADGTIGDDIHIVNDPVTAYKEVLDLGLEQDDATGSTLTNRSFSFVVWGVQNKTGEPQHLMMNLPIGSYSRLSPDNAVSDALNYSVYEIPRAFQGVGFLIARFTFQLTATGNDWTLYDTEDLRGRVPNTTAGGGAGGTGVTTYLGLTDTPSAYTGEANNVPVVNAGETALEFLDITSDWLTQYLRTDGTRALTGNLAVDALVTIDGRDLSVDGSKLDGIATGADVTGANTPQSHNTSHQNGGSDEISVADLSGVLADDQHVIDSEAVSAMGVKGDSNPLNHDRYTDSEVTTLIGNTSPQVHASSHEDGGSDELIEEGTWTIGVSFGGGTTGITYDAAVVTGSYTKIGNRVIFNGHMVLTSKGSSTGVARITGLPYTTVNDNRATSALALYLHNISFANSPQARVVKNVTNIQLKEITEAGAVTDLTNANFANDSQIIISGSYEAA